MSAAGATFRDEPPLTAARLAAFRRDGYLRVRAFLDARSMARLSRWVDDLARAPERPGRHWVYHEDDLRHPGARVLSRIENFCPFHPELDALLTGPRVMRVMTQLLGEPAVLFKDKINYKMPGGAGFEPHQDVQAGWDRYADLHVTMMLAVDDTTPENGCLELAPGWHDRGQVGEAWTPLGDVVPADAYRACAAAAGDVVFFDSYVPHRSAPNRTERARRVLYATYNRASAGEQRERYYADKHASYPPDIDRDADREYVYRV